MANEVSLFHVMHFMFLVSRNNIIYSNKKVIAKLAFFAINFLYLLVFQQFKYGLVRTPFERGRYVTSNSMRTYVTSHVSWILYLFFFQH